MPEDMVGVEGFEPPTYCSQSNRATRLRYTPLFLAGKSGNIRDSPINGNPFFRPIRNRGHASYCRIKTTKRAPRPSETRSNTRPVSPDWFRARWNSSTFPTD